MIMTKDEFVSAVGAAVAAPAKSGAKWNHLEKLFADNGLRGNGALNNSGGADRTTRVRQLATSKSHNGQASRAVATHSVFVIGGDSVQDYKRDVAKYERLIEKSLEDEHSTFDSCLVVLAELNTPIRPVLLIKRGNDALPIPYEDWWPGLQVSILARTAEVIIVEGAESPTSNAVNMIYFGPPGTGKSTAVKRQMGKAPNFRTQFHPEYNHADLLGSYRPVVGIEKDAANVVVGHDGIEIRRPVNYFAFVPGPLTEALECAFGSASLPEVPTRVFLVIEEINRGDCAAIFGDAFQLLDRDEKGRSEFGITPKPELLAYLRGREIKFDIATDGKLYLPGNLSLLATMNTSDQSLYPMDSAFKRRWKWASCPIDFRQLREHTKSVPPFLDDGKTKWDWITLIERVNKNIVRDRMEDKQLGPWFVKPNTDGSVSFEDFLNKCLFYLWHDVFKDEQLSEFSPFDADGPSVFGEVQTNIQTNGLASGFKSSLLEGLAYESEPSPTDAEERPAGTRTAGSRATDRPAEPADAEAEPSTEEVVGT